MSLSFKEGVDSTSWKFNPQLYIVKMALYFWTKFLHADQRCNRYNLTPLCLKFDVSAHVQLKITCNYMLFANFWS